MASFTGGGLVKTSLVMDPETMRDIAVIAQELRVSKSVALRLISRRGVEAFRSDQQVLRANASQSNTLNAA